MTTVLDLLKEAIWSLEQGDAPNAAFCVDRASVLLGTSSTETSVKKSTKRKKKKRKKNLELKLFLVGTLPNGLTSAAFRAAVLPMMEDVISGEVMYLNYTKMANGTFCYNFSGMCPIHKRVHTDVGPWQLKQHSKSEWCGFKCWKQDSYSRQFSNPILCDM